MLYFNEFPKVQYKFGNEIDPVIFQDISIYADVVDQVKDSISFLNVHTIQEGFRPDQVSIQLYGTSLYYWTFFLLNDNIRQQGWPLTRHELASYIQKVFPNTTLTIRDIDLPTKFKVGQTVSGGTSGASGKIIRRNLNLGQIVIEGNVGFRESGELLTSVNSSGVSETMSAISSSKEYLSAAYYIDGTSALVDIDPATGPGALLTEKTHEDVYFATNESLRQIKVIKPSQITNIITSFKRSVRG
jgi:hypothetical protein